MRRDMRDNYERERETVRLNGDWGQSQSQSKQIVDLLFLSWPRPGVTGAPRVNDSPPSTEYTGPLVYHDLITSGLV